MTLFVPSSRLLATVGDSQQAQKLCLASRDWFDLQNHVAAVLALPYDYGEYQKRYGDASSGPLMEDCFNAMRKLRQVAAKYGDPAGLRARVSNDPNALAGLDRPEGDVYSAIIWTVQRAHQDAFSLATTLGNIPAQARGESPADVVAGIKSLFLDSDQIVDNMVRTRKQLDALIEELGALEDELEASQLAMQTFTDRSSKTRQALNREIGDLEVKIADLEKARAAAYQKWLDLTISAAVVPAAIGILGIALMIILGVATAGTGFAVGGAITGGLVAGTAAALGAAAGVARGKYDGLVAKVETEQAFRRKRITFRHDLGALDQLMGFSLPASSGLIGQVRVVRDAWESSIREIRSRVADLTVGNLSQGPWLKPEEMAKSAANWTRVDDALQAFAVSSFVDSNVADFGSSLPADDPQWQQRFISQFAA